MAAEDDNAKGRGALLEKKIKIHELPSSELSRVAMSDLGGY